MGTDVIRVVVIGRTRSEARTTVQNYWGVGVQRAVRFMLFSVDDEAHMKDQLIGQRPDLVIGLENVPPELQVWVRAHLRINPPLINR